MRPAAGRLVAALAAAFALACGDSDPAKPGAEKDGAAIVVTVSIDWEGAYFGEAALAALTRFRTDNPDVPLTHFVSAAYYTKPNAKAELVSERLREHVRKGDEVGVHLHAWKSLVEAAGVPVRTGRSFLTVDGKLMDFDDDTGFDVDPSVYTASELRTMLTKSRELLRAGGLEPAPIFRAGGWLARPNVLEAIRAEGIEIDSSAIDADWLDDGDMPGYEVLAQRVREVWPKVDRTTQPFLIETPAGQVLEMPDTGGMADQVTSERMEEHVQWAVTAPKRPIFIQLGFHAETADDHAASLTRTLANLRRRKVPLQFVTLTRAAELARKAGVGALADPNPKPPTGKP